MSTMPGMKSPRYGYYPNPDDHSVVEYGDYDTVMQYAPYKRDNPRRGSAKHPPGARGEPDAKGHEIDPPDPDRAFDPSFGGINGRGPNTDGSEAGPQPGGFPQRRRRQSVVSRSAPPGPLTSLISRELYQR